MDDLISIIVPVFNIENYISRCVDSIIKQDYLSFELILLDDGSTDKSGEICEDYAIKDSRIIVYHLDNGGPSRTRNFGIDRSKGKYITFIDGDDWVDVKYLSTLMSLLDNSRSDISMVNYVKTSSNIPGSVSDIIELKTFSNLEMLNQYFNEYHSFLVTVWGKLYKRTLFEKVRFLDGRLHEDVFFTYQIIFAAKQITLSTEVLYYYWKRPESITGTFYIERQYDHLDALFERALFFKKLNLIWQYRQQIKVLFSQFLRTIKYFDITNDRFKLQEIRTRYKDYAKHFSINNIGIPLKTVNVAYQLSPTGFSRLYFAFGKLTQRFKQKNA